MINPPNIKPAIREIIDGRNKTNSYLRNLLHKNAERRINRSAGEFARQTILDMNGTPSVSEHESRRTQVFDIILNNSQAIITLIKPDHTRVFSSKAYQDMTGNNVADAVGKNALESVHPQDRQQIESEIRNVVQRRESVAIQYRLKLANGKFCWMLGTFSPVAGANGEVESVVVVSKNITQVKEVIEQKDELIVSLEQANDKLEKLHAEKTELYTLIAHDLRSPFAGIAGIAEVIENEIGKINELEDSKDIKKEIEEAHKLAIMLKRSTVKASVLLTRILEWTRSIMNGQTIKPVSLKLREVVDVAILDIRENADKKNISVHNKIMGDVGIFADEESVGAILRNLLMNAVKFSPRGGIILVDAHGGNNSRIVVEVRDFGRGMNADEMKRIFSTKNAVYTSYGTDGEVGTGLGLKIVKNFVESMGGEVWVESQVGFGSSFKFTLIEDKLRVEPWREQITPPQIPSDKIEERWVHTGVQTVRWDRMQDGTS